MSSLPVASALRSVRRARNSSALLRTACSHFHSHSLPSPSPAPAPSRRNPGSFWHIARADRATGPSTFFSFASTRTSLGHPRTQARAMSSSTGTGTAHTQASGSASAPSGTSAKALAQESCVPCRKGGTPLDLTEAERLVRELNESAGTGAGEKERGWRIERLSSSISSPAYTPSSSSSSGQPPAQSDGSAGIPTVARSYSFRNFRTALAFANAVGALAEREKHHPELVIEWGRVGVRWWTHAIGGLHKNDLICASKTEELAKSAEGIKR